MASSAIQPSPPGGLNPNRSWASIAARNKPNRISLLATPSTSPTDVTMDESDTPVPTTLQSNVWKTGSNSGSFFLDISSRKEGDSIIYRLILAQFSSCRGALPNREGGRRLLEINIDPSDGSQTYDFSRNGLLFPDNVRIIPTKALPASSNVVKLRLSRLPLMFPHQLEEGLTESLSQYGEVLDLGILTDPLSGMFQGTGYAILETSRDSEFKSSKPLTHNIPFPGLENGFFANWDAMPEYCKYCHSDGHIRANCPVARPLRLCYSCNKPGHVAASCKKNHATSKPPSVSQSPPSPPSPPTTNPDHPGKDSSEDLMHTDSVEEMQKLAQNSDRSVTPTPPDLEIHANMEDAHTPQSPSNDDDADMSITTNKRYTGADPTTIQSDQQIDSPEDATHTSKKARTSLPTSDTNDTSLSSSSQTSIVPPPRQSPRIQAQQGAPHS